MNGASQKGTLIPRLAFTGICKNGSTYLPYIGVSIFAVFTYFAFDMILNNDIMRTIPKAAYATMLMDIGGWLLQIIMVPFLFYTNNILMKRRKKELGLYSILGMEKKHIGMLLLCESAMMYVVVVGAAIGLGLLFSKLLFLLLINLAGLSVEAGFSISGKSIMDTLVFYGVISLLNLTANLIQVGRANPTELLSESRKGEREPKFVWLWAIIGLLSMGGGYFIALSADVNSNIFIDFFDSVLLVVIGTYMLFTSGSIVLLLGMKKNKRFYYKPDNFITISGMLYRMKKNAASLVNICIFATMAIITVICTVALYLGLPGIVAFETPFDMEVNFMDSAFTEKESWKAQVEMLAEEQGVEIMDYQAHAYVELSNMGKKDGMITRLGEEAEFIDRHVVKILTVEELNALEESNYQLAAGEVLMYSTGEDFGEREVTFVNCTYQIAQELTESRLAPKAVNNRCDCRYMVIVPGEADVEQIAAMYGVNGIANKGYKVQISLTGTDEERTIFFQKLQKLAESKEGFASAVQYMEDREKLNSMYGGLLFIGIFFGLIFAVCLLIIMYYKQIAEGFEDQRSFEIMQKVGMSDEEVRQTIRRQILMVFFVPVLGAFCHTAVAMNMVIKLMASINMYQVGILLASAVGVCFVFAGAYSVCYHRTARAYYRIVRRM